MSIAARVGSFSDGEKLNVTNHYIMMLKHFSLDLQY